MAVLVDANVIIDIATEDPAWSAWSAAALERAGREGRLVINPVIYAEVSIAYARIETLEAALPDAVFSRETISPGRPRSSPARRSSPIALAAARGASRCRTSSSAPMRRSGATGC